MPRYLIDTHVLIWWWDEPERLSEPARSAMTDPDNTVFVSAASAMEIAIKVCLGKLPPMGDKVAVYEQDVLADGLDHLSIRCAHALRAGLMVGEHRDPFDRIIAAQALIEDLTVITRDKEIAAFGCKVLW